MNGKGPRQRVPDEALEAHVTPGSRRNLDPLPRKWWVKRRTAGAPHVVDLSNIEPLRRNYYQTLAKTQVIVG